jgi:ribokinase
MAETGIFILGSFVAACSAKTARLPVAGESLLASGFLLEAGGKGFNLAAGVRRLDADVDGIFAIGDDFLSGLAEPALRRAGLRAEMLVRYPGATGAGVGFVDAGAENCLAVFPGANWRLSAADVDLAAARVARAALVLAQFEIGDAPIRRAFGLARDAGRVTILNPSPYRPIDPGILGATSILVVNQVEAARLGDDFGFAAGKDADFFAQLAQRLFERGLQTLVVTLGAGGAVAFEEATPPRWQAAFAVDAVDSMGAGDAFTAAFAVALAERRGLADALRWGAAAGACAASRPGVFDALPARAALEAMLLAGG